MSDQERLADDAAQRRAEETRQQQQREAAREREKEAAREREKEAAREREKEAAREREKEAATRAKEGQATQQPPFLESDIKAAVDMAVASARAEAEERRRQEASQSMRDLAQGLDLRRQLEEAAKREKEASTPYPVLRALDKPPPYQSPEEFDRRALEEMRRHQHASDESWAQRWHEEGEKFRLQQKVEQQEQADQRVHAGAQHDPHVPHTRSPGKEIEDDVAAPRRAEPPVRQPPPVRRPPPSARIP